MVLVECAGCESQWSNGGGASYRILAIRSSLHMTLLHMSTMLCCLDHTEYSGKGMDTRQRYCQVVVISLLQVTAAARAMLS